MEGVDAFRRRARSWVETHIPRAAAVTVLRAEIAAAILERKRQGLLECLGREGVPIAPVLSRAEMLESRPR